MPSVMSVVLAAALDPATVERERITSHLQRTELELRARDVSGSTAEQRRARRDNLDALHRYWVRGVYPHNDYVSGQRVPVFIDDAGRTCAVGQLMIDSGAAALALQVAAEERLEYIATIETEGVAAWAASSGLTLAELARIQPSYCGCGDEPVEPVCGEDGETYPNVCVAHCAVVEVEHEGPCPGSSESGDGVTEGATTGEGDASSSGSSSSGAGTSSSSGEGSSEAGSTTTESVPAQAQRSGSGCRAGDAPASSWWLVLGMGLLGWRRRE